MAQCMTAAQALAFVEQHGVVLVSAKGPAPRLTEAIAGEAIAGSWWSHPQGRQIYAVLNAVTDFGEVLVCRLIGGRLTLVHRRLWPSLVSIAGRFEPAQLAQVQEQHTPSGRHTSSEVPFPQWVPAAVREQGRVADEAQALADFSSWLPR